MRKSSPQLSFSPKPRHLFMLSGLSGTVAVIALRDNYQTMVELRSAVFAADEQDGDVETALRELREHVHGHMNTSLSSGPNTIYPPIQLKYRYDRLAAAQQASANDSQMYSDAQAYCEQQNPADFSGRSRVPCIEQYVRDNGGQPQVAVPDSLYKFNFVTPSWSPDLAGWSLVLAGVFFLGGLGLLLKRWYQKRYQ